MDEAKKEGKGGNGGKGGWEKGREIVKSYENNAFNFCRFLENLILALLFYTFVESFLISTLN